MDAECRRDGGYLLCMPTTTQPIDEGRAVFASAVNAAVDDFTQVSGAHLAAAVGYAEAVFYLLPRARKVLRLLKVEQSRRALTRRPGARA